MGTQSKALDRLKNEIVLLFLVQARDNSSARVRRVSSIGEMTGGGERTSRAFHYW